MNGEKINEEEELVLIIRHARDTRGPSEIPVSKIMDVKWDDISGGAGVRQAGLYGFIWYDEAPQYVSCSGQHGTFNAKAKVYIPVKANQEEPYRAGYERLKKLAGPKPSWMIRSQGKKACTKRLLEVLREHGGECSRADLRSQLKKEGYNTTTIRNALKRMGNDKKIDLLGSPHKGSQIIKIIQQEEASSKAV